jgi:demethylmenaquinone methyltransferase/2-methoxy-6-polyprenyl-1,4-benzoquinol methylase
MTSDTAQDPTTEGGPHRPVSLATARARVLIGPDRSNVPVLSGRGVDASQGMVDYANKTFTGVDFQVGGLEELAFGDDEFDVVFAANSVQYASDLGTALQELRRVCKPGGSIVAGLFGPPETVSYKPVLDALRQFMPKPPPGGKPGGPFRLSAPGCSKRASRRLESPCHEPAK